MASPCQAQSDELTPWEFYELLSEEANAELMHYPYELVNLNSLNKEILNANAYIGIDETAQWNLLFENVTYWESIIGGPQPSPKNVKPKKFAKKFDRRPVRYLSTELIEGLQIDLSSLTITELPKDGFLEITARDHPYNTKWIPIQSDDYLIIRHVHSYPHGNMTSFYGEIVLYFERAIL